MASRLRCETVSLEFRDLQATTMSLNSTGQYALLAGRKYLGILDLGNPSSGDLLVRIPYGGKYEISGTQWSSQSHANVLAVASSQRCDIFELTDGAELKCTYRLKCHSRVITDLDWSRLSPNLLATSSFDSYVHIWDIREGNRTTGSEKPQQSLSALDGASQVRWNKWRSETLASCDGGHVKIWDMRKPNSPSEYIAAHSLRINGLEWLRDDTVITAAQDHTVKFSRTAPNPAKSKGPCLTLNSAVWRARPTPFGRGLLTQCVPILRRDSGILCLWDYKRFNSASPIFTFQAYDIVEFAWKKSDGPSSTMCNELITWSRDQILRVWTLPAHIISLCGEKDSSTSTTGSERRGSSQTCSDKGDDKATDDGMLLLSDEDEDDEDEVDGEFLNGSHHHHNHHHHHRHHISNNVNNCCNNDSDNINMENENDDFTSSASNSSSRFANHKNIMSLKTNGESNNSSLTTVVANNGQHSSSDQQGKGRKSLTSINFNTFNSPTPSYMSKRDELLKNEFESVVASKPESLLIEQMEVERGLFRFSWRTDPKGGRCAVVVIVTFPHSYPASVPQFLASSSASEVDNGQVQKILKQTAQQCARKKEPCLHQCINQFAAYMNLVKPEVTNDFLNFPSRGVSNVPFPRTSGARFCSVGVLICFGRPSYLKKVKLNCDAGTPRSLSALGPFLSQLALDNSSRRRSRRTEKKRAGVVTVFDVCQLLPFSRELASTYTHLARPIDRQSICLANEKKALSMNCARVAHAWQAAGVIAKYVDRANLSLLKKAETDHEHAIDASTSSLLSETYGDDEDVNWIHYHPLGSKLINSIIQHYAVHGDVQTAASIACIFSTQENLIPPTTTQHPPYKHESTTAIVKSNSLIQGQGSKTKSCLKKNSSICSQSPPSMSSSNAYASHQNVSNSEQQSQQQQLASPMSSRSGGGKSGQGKQPRLTVPKWWTKGMSSPYHTVHGSDTLHGVVVHPLTDAFFRQHRSNSWSDSLDDPKAIQAASMTDLQSQQNGHEHNGLSTGISLVDDSSGSLTTSLTTGLSSRRSSVALKKSILDPNMSRLYDCYKKSYAEILYRWGHLQQRAEVLKCLTERQDASFLLKQGVGFAIYCKKCNSPSTGPYCLKCKRLVSFCSICHMFVKGLSTYCFACGHGGHVSCILSWFTKKQQCPTGCTCKCVEHITKV